ncbi:unnamed protein product [Cercospora beticola]|nr:unnamed protein product [Cercospora beticola]
MLESELALRADHSLRPLLWMRTRMWTRLGRTALRQVSEQDLPLPDRPFRRERACSYDCTATTHQCWDHLLTAIPDVANTQVPAQPVDSGSDSGVPVIPRRRTATFIIGPDHSQETTEADTPEVQAVLLPDGMVPVPSHALDQQQPEGEAREDSDTFPAPSASYADLSSSAAQAPEASSSDTETSHVVEPSPSTSTITSPRPKGKERVNEPGPSGTSNRTGDDDDRHLVHEQPTPRAQAASHPPAQPGYVDPTTGIDSGVSEEAYRRHLADQESSEDNEVIGDDNGTFIIGDDNGSESDEANGTSFD